MWVLILAMLLATLAYVKMKKVNQHWKNKGISYVKPLPLFGNMAANVFRRRALIHVIDDLYKAYPDERYIGIYQFAKPTLLIRDPELIKHITVKDFDVFPEHSAFVDPEVDPLFGKNLFSMRSNDGWHDMRATLSPAFTSSKLRSMFLLMRQCSKQFVEYFQSLGETVSVELKDAFTRFTNDVIGTTAFGVNCDSLKDRYNEFYMMGKEATNFTGLKGLIFFGNTISPTLMKMLNITLFSKEIGAFFRRLIKETIRVREEKHILRPDMIHLLTEARKGRLKHEEQDGVVDSGFAVVQGSEIGKSQKKRKAEITDDDITAQALIFFVAGFDGVSTLMCYIAYELAIHPEIQEKLRQEVDAAFEANQGQLTYEAVLGMKYLDQVVSETLRRRPLAAFMDRKSVRPYIIEPKVSGEKPLYLEEGSVIWIPSNALHMDSKYYPDPEKFDPERFSERNKHNIKDYAYLPFGMGPRNCIGSRFALLESKLIIVELLRKFELVSTEKTSIPIVLSKSSPNPVPEKGIWLDFKLRSVLS